MRSLCWGLLLSLACAVTLGPLPSAGYAESSPVLRSNAGRRELASATPVAVTQAGWVQGNTTAQARVFLGIPYARPPVNELRWLAPVSPVPWFPELYLATSEGPACPQPTPCPLAPSFCAPLTHQSEDCLYANVFAPLDTTGSGSWPVIVYVHGGGFSFGQGGGDAHDGEYLANATQSVVVTFNYRLGALGSMVSTTETGFGGNVGLQDQLQLLTWVRRNIESFGGDRSRVALWGQGSGAMSAAAHAVNSDTWHLYQRLILSTAPLGMPFRNRTEAEFMYSAFMEATGCKSGGLTCLQSLSTAQVIAAQAAAEKRLPVGNIVRRFEPWTPVVGTPELPRQPIVLWLSGAVAPVPMVIGAADAAATQVVYSRFPDSISNKTLLSVIGSTFGHDNVAAITKLYNTTADTVDERGVAEDIFTDAMYLCPARNASRRVALLAAQPKSSVYAYRFNHAWSFGKEGWGTNLSVCVNQTCAGSEVPFLFHSSLSALFTGAEQRLSQQMVLAWGSFAATGVPSATAGGLPAWDAVNTTAAAAALFDFMTFQTSPPSAMTDAAGVRCELWDAIGYGHEGRGADASIGVLV